MAEAAVFFDGKVRQTTDLTDVTFNNKTGFVTNFKYKTIKYTHVLKDKFTSIGINTNDATAGYYNEAVFLKFLAKDRASISDLTASKLILSTIPNAVENDAVRVQFLKITAPYTDFCTVSKYTWHFNPAAQVLDDQNLSIILQPGYQLAFEKLPLSSIPNSFYAKNIRLITSADFLDDKDSGAYYISLIALQIYRINKDIFPLFYQSPELTNYITTQNLEWQNGNIFNQPSLQDLVDYYVNLTTFYNSAYANQLVIGASSEKTKLFWLASCLTAQGLSVFSVYDKIYIITQAILQSKKFAVVNVASGLILPPVNSNLQRTDEAWISRISSKLILKIIESVTLIETQCDDFLAQLNGIGNWGLSKDETLFEVIYNFLGDNQIGKLIGDNKAGRIIGGLFGNPDDRKNFINFLYTIWQTSIYNPYYESAKYDTPADKYKVFRESYYMTDQGIKHYNPDNGSVLFVFQTTDTSDPVSYTHSFDFDLKRDKITAYQTVTIVINEGPQISDDLNKTLYGTYDLYQPIAVTGFKADLDVTMPKANCFPLFFMYYAEDYKDVKDADAAIELVTNLALNFTGIGEAADLGYLMRISEFGELAELPATKAVLSWTAKEGVNHAVQLTAGNALAISNYVTETATDERLKNFSSKLNIFLGAALLGSLSYHAYTKQKVTLAAIDADAEYEALKVQQIETNFSDYAGAVKAFAEDEVAKALLKFSNKGKLTDEILALSDADRLRFVSDFGNAPSDFFELLETYPEYVRKWFAYTEDEKLFARTNQLKSLEEEIQTVLRYEKLYKRPSDLYELMDTNVVLINFGQNCVNLVHSVENKVSTLLSTYSRTELGKMSLVSGMVDNETGVASDLFVNFYRVELEKGNAYEEFLNELHPNLKNRLIQTTAKRGIAGEGYNMNIAEDIVYTGDYIGAHAEFRALDDLAKKKWGTIEVEQGIFDLWLTNVFGYNRRIIDLGIMHTCADCFYLTDGVTFIKLKVRVK